MPNQLIHESSPYLLQHAHNPVAWYPWGDEAFELARTQNKPIFLSIGYAACHWCHVMAHESFEDPDIANLMNSHFINIKVDREERPDVDSIYMEAVVSLTGQGGWPMSVFLTPDLAPFYGGTYFPPTRRYNMPSFPEILQQIGELWQQEPDRIATIGQELTKRLQPASPAPDADEKWDEAGQQAAMEKLLQRYDWKHGGWGGPPKFPQPAVIASLINASVRGDDALARDMAWHALDAMAAGGMYDQLGGGFHRYAVDASWRVPHFEKMLYDNACLLSLYLRAWKLSGRPRYLEIVNQTFDFLVREMRSPAGGFYASLDADSEGVEGKYYTWQAGEIEAALEDADFIKLASLAFDHKPGGNLDGAHVLAFPHSEQALAEMLGLEPVELARKLNEVRERLFALRSSRVRPATDDKVIASWNGLLLSALAECADATGRAAMLSTAQELAAFLLDHLVVEDELRRTWRAGKAGTQAFLEDHAALALGLLSLYGLDFQNRWLVAARRLGGQVLDRFLDPAGGFFDTPAGQANLIARPKSSQDSPSPSGGSMAASLMLQLYALTGEDTYREAADAALGPMVSPTRQHPTAFAGWLDAFEHARRGTLQLAIVGDPRREDFQRLLKVVSSSVVPDLVRAGGLPDDPDSPAILHGRTLLGGNATAYLCKGFTCDLPTSDPEKLSQQIAAAYLA
jgi:uncharacterized protein YyaL (SSP411 family)